MARDDDAPMVVPLLEEELHVATRKVETGRVRISTRVEERQAWIEQALEHEDVVIERVPIDQVVTTPPPVRQEGDVLIVPLLEEVVVVEKRLVLREELHVRKRRTVEQVREPVTVRSEQAVIEQMPVATDDDTASPSP